MSTKEILEKLRWYCAKQERCQQDVINKLFELKVYGDEADEILIDLISNDFLNEERFAKAFARGKFRIKRWGKIKIVTELKKRNISEYCINKGLKEITNVEYIDTLQYLIQRQKQKSATKNSFEQKNKIAKYCINKGYESNLVWQEINSFD